AGPVVVVAAVVAQEAGTAAIGGDQDIELAVAIDVGVGGAAADERLEQVAARVLGGDRHEDEAMFQAAIPEKLRRLGVGLAELHLADILFEVAIGGEQVGTAAEIV